MSDIERTLEHIQSTLSSIKYEASKLMTTRRRPVLYAIALIAAGAAISTCDKAEQILDRLDAQPEIQVRNVIGNVADDEFYDIDGQRAYVSIDGVALGDHSEPSN